MKYWFRFDPEKNQQLLQKRGIGFEDVIQSIESGNLLGFIDNPARDREHQKIFIIENNSYTYIIPAVHEWDNIYFLKTIIPSRKYQKRYNS